jgi:hypothetical protein
MDAPPTRRRLRGFENNSGIKRRIGKEHPHILKQKKRNAIKLSDVLCGPDTVVVERVVMMVHRRRGRAVQPDVSPVVTASTDVCLTLSCSSCYCQAMKGTKAATAIAS